MENQLILGTTDIGEYITPAIREGLNEKRILKELEKRDYLGFKYPQVDLSFLGMSNKIQAEVPIATLFGLKHKLSEISVPKFNVYQFYGDNKFKIFFHPEEDEKFDYNRAARRVSLKEKGLSDFKIINIIINEKDKYDKIIYNNLAHSFEPLNFKNLNWQQPNIIEFEGDHKDIIKYGSSLEQNLTIQSKFNGLIPETTIEKVKDAEKDFGKEHIYIVSETAPQQWNKEYATGDPLIIGITNSANSYLIDHFDTTPLEDIVRETWKINKKN
jgi:hypothetical protein